MIVAQRESVVLNLMSAFAVKGDKQASVKGDNLASVKGDKQASLKGARALPVQMMQRRRTRRQKWPFSWGERPPPCT